MVEVLIDSVKDSIKVFPILFIIFILVDFILKKTNKENMLVDKALNYDYIGGSFLGLIPQCGIPVAMANLYSSGRITLGMLIAVFLSSSDEALIIIGAHPEKLSFVLKLVGIKILTAVTSGFLINTFFKEKINRLKSCGINCNCPRCKPHKNIFTDNLLHTLKITIYLIISVFIINFVLDRFGQDSFTMILGKNNFLQPVFAAFVGMIPSCASSVVLAEAYIKGAIGIGTLLSGLCANTGYGVLIILKELPLRKSMKIIIMLLAISITIGEIAFFLGR